MKSENKYWEFTEEEMHYFGHRLRRIRALINLPERRVKKGDIGSRGLGDVYKRQGF